MLSAVADRFKTLVARASLDGFPNKTGAALASVWGDVRNQTRALWHRLVHTATSDDSSASSSAATLPTAAPPHATHVHEGAWDAVDAYLTSDAFGVLDAVDADPWEAIELRSLRAAALAAAAAAAGDSGDTAERIMARVPSLAAAIAAGTANGSLAVPGGSGAGAIAAGAATLSALATRATPLNVEQAYTALRAWAPAYMARVDAAHDLASWRPEQAALAPGLDPDTPRRAGTVARVHWSNPLTAPLPVAPTSHVYCMYGVGKPTERAYHYAVDADGNGGDGGGGVIDTRVTTASGAVSHGVQLGDGDSTVPLMSLGYMCARGWGDAARNPGGSPVHVREHSQDGQEAQAAAAAAADARRRRAMSTAARGRGGRRLAPSALLPASYNDDDAEAADVLDSELLAAALAAAPPSPPSAAAAAVVRNALEATWSPRAGGAPVADSPVMRQLVDRAVALVFEVSASLAAGGLLQGGFNLLRGENSADHVDILLNTDFIETILRIATDTPAPDVDASEAASGVGGVVRDRVLSHIRTHAVHVDDAPVVAAAAVAAPGV